MWAMAGSRVAAIGFRGSMLERIWQEETVSYTVPESPGLVRDVVTVVPCVLSRWR